MKNKLILISQRIIKNEYETKSALSLDWIDLLNNYKDTNILPIFPNSNLYEISNNFNITGIIISGGNDVSTAKANFISFKKEESIIRDNFEEKLLDFAINNKIPLLAICRGCQLLCHLNGYKLINKKGHVATEHKLLKVNETKYLNNFLDNCTNVNSFHNQCIEYSKDLNSELNVICTSEDGYVEAIEYKNEKVLGIMWHPERNTSCNHKNDIKLISNFFDLSIKKTKALILCAGKGTRLRPLTDDRPKCMVEYKNTQIIDYIIESLRLNELNDIVLIKGYLNDKLTKNGTKEVINEKYATTNMVYTLFKAIEHMDGDSDIIISYSDIVYSPEIIKKLLEDPNPLGVVIDKDWYNLWSQRMDDPLSDAETLKINKYGYITEIGKKPNSYSDIEGQYIGLIKIRADMVKKIVKFYQESKLDDNIYLTDFLTLVSKNICPLKAVTINGGWAEFDTLDDLKYNLDVSWYKKKILNFSSKADNLFNLNKKLKTALISELYHFNYKEWKDNQDEIIKNITNKFSKNVIVRSSSMNEDTIITSNAGQFLSLNNINSKNSIELVESIKKVFNSYGNPTDNDQILVQESLNNIMSCGVFFTFDCLTNSYYYTLTYDETGSSDSVTAGTDNSNQKCIYRVKNSNNNVKNKYLNELIKLSNELEHLYDNDKLDIEFAFVKNDDNLQLYLLQVRPLVVTNKSNILESNLLQIYHDKIYRKFNKYFQNNCYDLYGNQSYLSVMTDWNPAEIIGLKPKQLALSIYKEIITDFVAMLSRKECGYKDLTNHPLLISLINRPYIDTRISFSSLIPKDLNDLLSDKLCNYYLNKLKNNPDLHDKVEFNICFTCNTINLTKKLSILKEYEFSNDEINEINNELVILTNNIVNPEMKRIEIEYERLDKLEMYKNEILNDKLDKFETDKIYELTEILKKYGTLPFSNLARFAFIGKSILLSFVEENILTNERYNEFMETIHTVSKDMSKDIYLYSIKEISKEEFLSKYGHLRPGTYDITSLRYDEDFEKYFSKEYIDNLKLNKFEEDNNVFILTEDERSKINISLKKSKFSNNVNADNILEFIKKSTESREYSKFIFSKTLSEILKIIKDLLNIYDISEENGSNIDFKIFNEIYSELKLLPIKDIIMNNIEYNLNNYKINCKLNLPQLIVDPKEIIEFKYINTKPTFITSKKIQKNIISIDPNNVNVDGLKDKIVCVCNADPGWEWLFSRDIAGLITCYGGMNSHMAIRCQELSLPAVIGCGPEKFNQYNKSKVIEIDCNLEVVRIIN